MKGHVVEVLAEASRMSTEQLERLMFRQREEREEDEAVISLEEETVRIAGEYRVIRRVFAHTSSSVEYATVGWVLSEDVDQCMTCSKNFWFFHSRIHCHACGNINCSDCASSICIVRELPDMVRGVPVCNQCYWGQDPVCAWHRKSSIAKNLAKGKNRSLSSDLSIRRSDAESVDSFQLNDDRDYITDGSDSDHEEDKKLNQTRQESQENEEIRRFEAEQARRANRIADQNRRAQEKSTTLNGSQKSHDKAPPIGVKGSRLQIPEPLFVMKTTRSISTHKIYINVCTLRHIDMVTEFGCTNGICVNGRGIETIDRYSGEPVTIFDVLLNTNPSSKHFFDPQNMHDWMDEVCFQIIHVVNSECYETIDQSLPSIPKKKYKGTEIKPFDVIEARDQYHRQTTERLHKEASSKSREDKAKESGKVVLEQSKDKALDKANSSVQFNASSKCPIPLPIFVIKTRRTGTGDKVFVNVGTLKDVDISRFGNRKGFVFNSTAPEMCADKSGENCFTYDVLINTFPSEKCFDLDRIDLWREEVGSQIVSAISSQFNENLEASLKFPKIKGSYKGDNVKPFDIQSAIEKSMLRDVDKRKSVKDMRKMIRKSSGRDLEKRASRLLEEIEDGSTSDDSDSGNEYSVSPLYVIKTKRKEGSVKAFINVCTVNELDIVSMLGGDGILLNGKEPLQTTDKSGESCITYDALVNTCQSSNKFYDISRLSEWQEEVSGLIVAMVNTLCNESLETVIKYPSIKGNYKGDVVKPFKPEKSSFSSLSRITRSASYGTGSPPPTMKGWLKKQRRGGRIKNWKKRYCVLFGGELRYFEEARDTPPFGYMEKGNIDLAGAELEERGELQLFIKGKEEKDLLLEAESVQSRREWAKAIRNHIIYLA